MSSSIVTIARCKKGSKSFQTVLKKVREAYPQKPESWQIGVAVHIRCIQDSIGRWEYMCYGENTAPSWFLTPREEREINKEQVATIRKETIVDKYQRYLAA